MVRVGRRIASAAWVLGVLLGMEAVGAQKLKVETHVDPKADFKKIRTYGWLPPVPVGVFKSFPVPPAKKK